jgi:hypothetical protein
MGDKEQRDVLQGMIDSGAINLDAVGRQAMELVPRAAGEKEDDYIIKIVTSVFHFWVIKDVLPSIGDLAQYKQMREQMGGEEIQG